MYISLHLYKNANFFPYSKDGNFDKVGYGEGEGYNINIPWSKVSFGKINDFFSFIMMLN